MLGIPFLDSAFLRLFSPTTYDDRIDRLNYFITSSLLTFFALLVSAKQYVGSPIQCWVPMEFKGGWEQYTEDYCFIKNTYWVHFEDPVPEEVSERHDAEIGYYQWVPIVLALQALMFFIPAWIWKTLNKHSGLDLDTIVKEAKNLRTTKCELRKTEIEKLSGFVGECLEFDVQRYRRRVFCFSFGTSLGSYVSLLYLFVKFLYLINIFVQFVILNNFLGTDYSLWGFQTLWDLWDGRQWMDSGVFPRVTMCDFGVRRLGNVHRYSVQCVLMINMFNEKIYLFIWFWFLFVAVSTLLNFVYYFLTMMFASYREHTTKAMLSRFKLDDSAISDVTIMRRFVHNALRPDGVLLLRFVEMYAGGITAHDLCAQLFTDYCKDQCGQAGQTTKSSSPGTDEGFTEKHYDPQRLTSPLMQPDAFVRSIKGNNL